MHGIIEGWLSEPSMMTSIYFPPCRRKDMKKSAYLLFIILLSSSISGCTGEVEDATGEVEEEYTSCEEIGFTTHMVTTSYPGYEAVTWEESNPVLGRLYVNNSDLVHFDKATQVFTDGLIWNLTPYHSPIFKTHTSVNVEGKDGAINYINTTIGEEICLIENPDVIMEHDGRGDSRVCGFETVRLQNGSYEHHSPECNVITSENLDRTSTLSGGVEIPGNRGHESCGPSANFMDMGMSNSSLVGVNLSVAGSWGHFAEGNEFTIHYSGIDGDYEKSYFIKQLTIQERGSMVTSFGIWSLKICNVAFVQLYADRNLSTLASLDRDLTPSDGWEVIANDCDFSRGSARLGESQLMFVHMCAGVNLGYASWVYEDQPDLEFDSYPSSMFRFYENYTQALIDGDFSAWHSMLDDDVHAIDSAASYHKENLTLEFFDNLTARLGSIALENSSRLDIAQTHHQVRGHPFLSEEAVSFNWTFGTNVLFEPQTWVESPLAGSALAQDRIYNHTGWGYDGVFTTSEYEIFSWIPSKNAMSILSEHILTVVIDRGENGELAVVGIPDSTV